jgi:hypothetical protein
MAGDKPLRCRLVGSSGVDPLPPHDWRGMALTGKGYRPCPVAVGPVVRKPLSAARSVAGPTPPARPIRRPAGDLLGRPAGRSEQGGPRNAACKDEAFAPRTAAGGGWKCHTTQYAIAATKSSALSGTGGRHDRGPVAPPVPGFGVYSQETETATVRTAGDE